MSPRKIVCLCKNVPLNKSVFCKSDPLCKNVFVQFSPLMQNCLCAKVSSCNLVRSANLTAIHNLDIQLVLLNNEKSSTKLINNKKC